MRILLLGLVAVSLGVAAQTPPEPPAAAETTVPSAADQKQVCTTEKPVGSNRKVRTCRSAAQVEAERKAAQDALTGPRSDL